HARIAEAEVDLGAIHFTVHGEYDHVKTPPAEPAVAAVAARRRGLRTDARGRPLELASVRPGAPDPPDSHRFRGTFDMPLTACQAMLDSTPRGLVPKIQGMRFAGSFAMRGRIDIDTAHLDRGFHLDWDTSNHCRVV